MRLCGTIIVAVGIAVSVHAESLAVKMMPDEKWWGLCNNFGREMPFSEASSFKCDLRKDNYSHQSLSFLCSNRGRVVWCAEPVGVSIDAGEIALESDRSEIIIKNDAGRNLAEAYRYAAKTWFPIPDMLAAGFVGCPFICPDMVGGGEWTAFLPGAPFDPELFIRSAQIQALCPMMQFSASPWRCLDAGNQEIVKNVVALRQCFAPKFVELAKESAKTGEPMMRNLEYCCVGHGYADVKDEFMMGDNLLVAPIVEKKAISRKVVLPPGRWKADDGQVYDGATTIEVTAPLERLPYFIRVSENFGKEWNHVGTSLGSGL